MLVYKCLKCPGNVLFHFPDESSPAYDYREAGRLLTDHAEQQHEGVIDYALVAKK